MKPASRNPALRSALALAACGIVSIATAQTTAPSASDTGDDEVITLSPFEVNSTKDVGYLAQNTLAGSRLNTSLKETAAAISVLTPEFLQDIGATNMKDVILFTNNAVPDIGDAAGSVNGNPLIGNDEWQLRIRGLAASYARNYFAWETSSDFYNVERIDQSRGPNSILFGFGAAGGIVNTSTKQAVLHDKPSSLTLVAGSWGRMRAAFDVNQVITPNELAVRVNGMVEDADSWREFETYHAERGHVALKWAPTHASTVRVEGEVGRVDDNVARPWLAVDQSSLWRAAGRPTFSGSWPSVGSVAATFWPDHLVVADDGVVRNWIGRAYGSNANGASEATGWNAPTWSAWPMTAAGLAIIPKTANLAGPDADRKTKYHTMSAFYENRISDRLSVEFALNHQSTKFFGYDADGSRATNYYGNSTEVWGDASADLPDGTVNANAGRLYLENNWTRRTQEIKSTQVRASVAYQFDTGDWATHRIAGMYEHAWRDFYRLEECEVFTDMPLDGTAAEADVNRVYRRHYFTEGNVSDIHQQSWKVSVPGAGWVPDQAPEDTSGNQDTVHAALQSTMLNKRLVTVFGFRADRMSLDYDPATRDATTRQYRLDPTNIQTARFNAHTFTAGGVYALPGGVSVYANHSNSREIPELRIHLIDSYVPPMPKGEGSDAGLKFDFFDGKVYATAGYYTTKRTQTTDWGDVQTAVTDLNTRVLAALLNAGLITQAERDQRLINANGYLEDSKAKGWEFSLIANPMTNWRISANFSINEVIKENVMSDVQAWADENTAFWVQRGGNDFLLGSEWDTWDTIGAQIGWLYQYHIDNVTALNGLQARGERKYGANLYTKYTFDKGPLKGLSIGGGGRYQSPNIVGFYNGAVREGRSLTLIDLSLGYSFKTEFLGEGSWLDLQLNVSNAFDEQDPQVYTLAWWDPTSSIPERIGLQEPRKLTLTAKLEF